MPEIASLTLFVSAAIVLLVIPGPAVLNIVARSLEQGRLAGAVSVLGVAAGAMVHVAAAALGLAALVMRSAQAFGVIKYLGAAYLVYLGIRTILSKVPEPTTKPIRFRHLSRLFIDGVVVNVLNPKTALFFLAFLPQFVNPSRGPVLSQVLFLGGLFITLAILSDMVYVMAASGARHLLSRGRASRRRMKNLSGATYIGLGLLMALTGKANDS